MSLIIAPPELASHLMVSVPLFILYEISIMISRIGYKKYLKSEEIRLKKNRKRNKSARLKKHLAATTTNRRIESTVINKARCLNGTPSFCVIFASHNRFTKIYCIFRVLEETFAMVPHRIVQVSQIH